MNTKNLQVMGIVGIRKGSTSVVDKNIRLLNGKPLVGWILETAMSSKYINRLVVSTDDEHYSEVARSFGAEVPCLRPPSLSTDLSPELEFVKHMLNWLEDNEGYIPDIVVRMLATSPLQIPDDIDNSIEILIEDPAANSAVIISEMRQHPYKALKIIDDETDGKKLVTYFEHSGRGVTPIARQNYETAYIRSNVIACRRNVVFDTNSLTGDLVRFHIIPQDRAIDIDNEIDFFICEQLLKKPY